MRALRAVGCLRCAHRDWTPRIKNFNVTQISCCTCMCICSISACMFSRHLARVAAHVIAAHERHERSDAKFVSEWNALKSINEFEEVVKKSNVTQNRELMRRNETEQGTTATRALVAVGSPLKHIARQVHGKSSTQANVVNFARRSFNTIAQLCRWGCSSLCRHSPSRTSCASDQLRVNQLVTRGVITP